MLENRRAAMLAFTQTEAAQMAYSYTRIAIGPAVESAIDSLEWSFWQYFGVGACSQVPPITATDDTMWSFLDQISPPADSDDAETALFDAYYVQAYQQLGYPDGGAAYLTPYLMYADADYAGMFPTLQPTYDGGTAMHDVDDFVEQSGDRLLFVYGQWDPWTGGEYTLGNATEALRLIQAQGTHNSELSQLAPADMQAAYADLAAWTGVAPAIAPRILIREPHVPPAIVRALRGRRMSP
jgi:hypothetical protein